MSRVWCDHWEYKEGYWRIKLGVKMDGHIDNIHYCSCCGAKKPQEPLSLASVIEKVLDPHIQKIITAGHFEWRGVQAPYRFTDDLAKAVNDFYFGEGKVEALAGVIRKAWGNQVGADNGFKAASKAAIEFLKSGGE